MGTTQGKIQLRKIGINLWEDNTKIYLKIYEVVEIEESEM
jgi:hypothetical protein